MKYILILVFGLSYQVFYAATMTLTAMHSVDGKMGSIRFDIDTTYAYPPFNVLIKGPNDYRDALEQYPDFSHIFTNLRPGEYCIVITNRIGCSANGCIEILNCNHYGGANIPSIVWCMEKASATQETGFYYVYSPSEIKAGTELQDIELHLSTSAPISSTLQESTLAKSIQTIYDIELNGKTAFDTLWQSDLSDEDANMVIKFSTAGDILWVYHREADEAERWEETEQAPPDSLQRIDCQVLLSRDGESLAIEITSPEPAPLEIVLYDLKGLIVEQQDVLTISGERFKHVFSAHLQMGTYVLKVLDSDKKSRFVKVLSR